jgi:hypothetical protein
MEIEATKVVPAIKSRADMPGTTCENRPEPAAMAPDVNRVGKKTRATVRDDKRALEILEGAVHWAEKVYDHQTFAHREGAIRTAESLFRHAADNAATADVAFLVGKVAAASDGNYHAYGAESYAYHVAEKLPPTPAATMVKLSLLFPSLFLASLFY